VWSCSYELSWRETAYEPSLSAGLEALSIHGQSPLRPACKAGWHMHLKRIVARLLRVWRHEVARWRPSGLFAWCYVRPGLPPEQALHRALWWRSRNRLPRLLWLPLEALRILHWQGLGQRRALDAAMLACAEQVAQTEGVAEALQRSRISVWSRNWCIPPEAAYAHGLYRDDKDGLALLYAGELLPYHRLMNARHGSVHADFRLIQDKQRLAERLARLYIPVVSTLRMSDGRWDDLASALTETAAVFCKLRYGSRGESAFMVQSSDAGLIGQTLAGKALENEVAVMSAWKTLTDKGTVLIQPFLRNHPLLQGLSPGADSITLRVITRRQGDSSDVWMGLLYVQAPGDSQEREYWLLKIDAESGQAFDAFGHWKDPDNDAENESSDDSKLGMLDGQSIPFWQDVVRHSRQAHAELPRLWAIAWDWIITPDGPVLLEGNAGWDISPLQELGVDFVKIGCEVIGNSLKRRNQDL
jgi:Sugar-transfer associated ATP-grasp